ncbi:GNAT family N-acetyltransferase [Sphingomonas quercus]|uniref:GNAT family N-acetyltransferase n=1 Tax=Sphingomonas quercus TaxID=2842451 RepID=A0ABS6BET4_9SPHN|nr:GNAT family N-acetyltransferase [Sphingomonas quercus]MBU3076817.1 GNAT family N-acetyltransferase [Sphingomonas quercus]
MIDTERLLLRPWREEDRPAFEALASTPGMTARVGGLRNRAQIDAMFARRLEDQARFGHCYWAMELRGTGKLVGSCGIRIAGNYGYAPVAGLAEIGWRVAERYWGRGLAREAAMASIDWGWANLDAPVIGAWTTIGNKRSWGLMERLGMKRRADMDFRHADYGPDDPAGAMIVYLIERPHGRPAATGPAAGAA